MFEFIRRLRPAQIIGLLAAVFLASSAKAELYGIGRGLSADTFYLINTTTGAATPLFSFPNTGTTATFGLAYNPVSNRYLTIQQTGNNSSALIEINANAALTSGVAVNVGVPAFEGVEYSASLGGIVLSAGNTTNATTRLHLLDSAYTLIASNTSTGLPDADTLFLDSSGGLNVLDTNNPYNGWQRNLITNPFTSISISVSGFQNPFVSTDVDAAWKGDEGSLFLTRTNSLARIVGPNNLFAVGPYGGGITITGIAVGPPIPEPTSLAVLAIGGGLFLRRRRA